MALNQSTSTRPTAVSKSRPATSMDNHSDDEDMPAPGGKRKGMTPLPPVSSSIQSNQENTTLNNRKLRAPQSLQPLRSQISVAGMRDSSVSTAMRSLNIHEDEEAPFGHQAISSTMDPPPLRHKASVRGGFRNARIDNPEAALVLFGAPDESSVAPKTPSQIPVLKSDALTVAPFTPCKTPQLSTPKQTPFLRKDSNLPAFTAWDVRGRLEDMETMYTELKDKMTGTSMERNGLEEAVGVYKARSQLDSNTQAHSQLLTCIRTVIELEGLRAQLSSSNTKLQTDLDETRQRLDTIQQRLLTATTSLDDQLRIHRVEMDDVSREHRNEVDRLRRDNTAEIDELVRSHRGELKELERRVTAELEDKIREIERRNDATLDEERSRRLREVSTLEIRLASEHQDLNLVLQRKDQEIENMRGELEDVRGELDREQTLKGNVQNSLKELTETFQKTSAETSTTIVSLESTVASLRARIHFLESGSKAQSDSFAEMEARLQEALRSAEVSKQKLFKEETLRRILFNQVQELKGNIRVMCRVRPVFGTTEGEAAKLTFPDVDKESKELEVLGKEEKSSLGNITRKTHSFTFDRVFGPASQNQEVFEEISQLVQSALDGYNVCIFCYGQTGSGKTHTMSSADGMIPRATHQIYETATNLQEKGWTYTMEGSFVEVYNEEIHDLLGNSKDFDKKKHEIKHDDQRKQTTVTGLKTVTLDSPNTVESILKQAASNRSVAATKSNERSSRSHSVFILKLVGRNSTTNETSEGTLNLVDLAGSERLKSSGAEGERMKETQNINKSLSCLGDVIGALGQGKEGAHIPYRNSKVFQFLSTYQAFADNNS